MINVWLVEDNAPYRRNLARAVWRDKSLCCGSEFDSVEDALAALRTEPAPDVVLLDVGLPGMDGISGISHLLEHAQGVSIVILTAFDDADKIYRAICAGASGYLLKTATISEVAKAVRQAAQGGAPMSPSVARRVLERFSEISPQPPKEGAYSLTSRELDTLRLMADGCAKKEIAAELGISSHTVNTHIRNIYDKLHVHTNTGAVANVCSPTRAALLTGKTPARLHITDFLSGLDYPHAASPRRTGRGGICLMKRSHWRKC